MSSVRRLASVVLAVFALVGLVAGPSARADGGSYRQAPDGTACDPITLRTAAPVATFLTTCTGVRPGALIEVPNPADPSSQAYCSLNFLFQGADGRRYVGSAGHCAIDEAVGGESTWPVGTGPVVKDGAGNVIGRFAWARLDLRFDMSLIRLEPGVAASPEVCHFGGPTGTYTATGSATVQLRQYGQGIGIGDVLPGRTMVALGTPSADHVHAEGLVLPGDSGSPAITADGQAVGVVVSVGLHGGTVGTSGVDVGTVGITRLPPQVARAAGRIGTTLTLVTAPLR